MTIAVASSKGGVSKTTVAAHLAEALLRRGRKVVLFRDADWPWDFDRVPQTRRTSLLLDLPSLPVPLLDATLRQGGPDLIVVPVQPAPSAWHHAQHLLDEFPQARVLVSMFEPRRRLHREFLELVSETTDRVFAVRITRYSEIEEAVARGETVRPGSPSSQEFHQLAEEVIQFYATLKRKAPHSRRR